MIEHWLGVFERVEIGETMNWSAGRDSGASFGGTFTE
jgi:hypothetical protein